MYFIGLYVKEAELSKLTKTTRNPGRKVLFVGNSWTQGILGTNLPYTGNDQERYNEKREYANARRYNSYVNSLSDALSFECINNGVGGSGYSVPDTQPEEVYKALWYDNRILNMVEKGVTPDIIIVGGAGNDIFARANDLQKVANAAQSCIDTVNQLNAKNHTNIKLIMIGVEKLTGDLREEFSKNAVSMNEALKEVALRNNVPLINFITNTTIASDGNTITKGETPFAVPEQIGEDNLHPTIEGAQEIGLRLAEEVQALLKYEGW